MLLREGLGAQYLVGFLGRVEREDQVGQLVVGKGCIGGDLREAGLAEEDLVLGKHIGEGGQFRPRGRAMFRRCEVGIEHADIALRCVIVASAEKIFQAKTVLDAKVTAPVWFEGGAEAPQKLQLDGSGPAGLELRHPLKDTDAADEIKGWTEFDRLEACLDEMKAVGDTFLGRGGANEGEAFRCRFQGGDLNIRAVDQGQGDLSPAGAHIENFSTWGGGVLTKEQVPGWAGNDPMQPRIVLRVVFGYNIAPGAPALDLGDNRLQCLLGGVAVVIVAGRGSPVPPRWNENGIALIDKTQHGGPESPLGGCKVSHRYLGLEIGDAKGSVDAVDFKFDGVVAALDHDQLVAEEMGESERQEIVIGHQIER